MKKLLALLLLASGCGAYTKGIYLRIDEAGVGTTGFIQEVVKVNPEIKNNPNPYKYKDGEEYKQIQDEQHEKTQ